MVSRGMEDVEGSGGGSVWEILYLFFFSSLLFLLDVSVR